MSGPIDKIAQALWVTRNRPSTRKEYLAEVNALVERLGLIDCLLPTWEVFRHNDPNTPGELRVKLSMKNVILVRIWFREAPRQKVEMVIPVDQWYDGIVEQKVLPQAVPPLVNILICLALKRDPPKPPEMKLVLPP